jgi:hypothetical protein
MAKEIRREFLPLAARHLYTTYFCIDKIERPLLNET